MYKMIVIDDENRILDGIVHSFPWAQMGFEIVAGFESSLLALEYIRANPVDVVLSDIQMPVLNGVELAGKLKEIRPQTEVLFISAYRDFEYARSAILLGVRAYITKPLRREEVTGTFRSLRADLDARGIQLGKQEPPPLYYESIIEEVKEYIRSQLAEASLERIALKIGLSTGYLSKLFKQKTGFSFSDYLLSYKMEQAAQMLLSTRMMSYEISELTGYDNPKNFSRSFKNFYGISPREYRVKGAAEK